jgi:hypothetical protein
VLMETVGLVLLGPSAAARIPLAPWVEPEPMPDPAVADHGGRLVR